MDNYANVKRRLASGWNTWNTRSVLSHVLLPQGFAVNLGVKEYKDGQYLKESLIGRFDNMAETVRPGQHAYDGSYTELELSWRGIVLKVQTATDDGDLVILVTPSANQKKPASLVVEAGMLWNRPGKLSRQGDTLVAELPDAAIMVHSTRNHTGDPYVTAQGPYLVLPTDGPIGLSTGKPRSIEEIESILEAGRRALSDNPQEYGDLAELYDAMQTCLAWDTIYDPKNDRVVSPVSRLWNLGTGGYVLFCWDSYFAALMASLGSKELAYSNAIEITREMTPGGFVPNFATGTGFKSLDRSQPPVGSAVVRELYKKFQDKWLLEELFSPLLSWNRWWDGNRKVTGDLLAWGSNPYEPVLGGLYETEGVGKTLGGAFESGLDNSPMYDDIPFDSEAGVMKLADVGLTSLYIMDCFALADIARCIGKVDEAQELEARGMQYAQGLQSLWSEEDGIFLNQRTDTGEYSRRLSPTNFYPLLSPGTTKEQADRMITEHFYSPDEFWGDYMLPSIARNDPAYPDQAYWRGRIWAPMNLLVYMGLRMQGQNQACKDLAMKSRELLLGEWRSNRHVHENYNAETGVGCDRTDSDKFYHWGALLSLICLMEEGRGPTPEVPLI